MAGDKIENANQLFEAETAETYVPENMTLKINTYDDENVLEKKTNMSKPDIEGSCNNVSDDLKPQIMFCNKCGQKLINADDVFCQYCGNKLNR